MAESGHPLPTPRRVVTSHDLAGRATVHVDHRPLEDGLDGIIKQTALWTTGSTPATDNNDKIDGASRVVPGLGLVVPNGTNLRVTDLKPGEVTPMHRTDSVDYNIIISGTAVLLTDDGSETVMGPGDTVIQRGTMHAWRNDSTSEWCRWISVLIHAHPAVVNGQVMGEAWMGRSKL